MLPVKTAGARGPRALLCPGHRAARNNRDWQEGKEGSRPRGAGSLRLRREKKREMYSGEESSGDNDVGACRSTLEQRQR